MDEPTVEMPLPYILTDGCTVAELRYMRLDELALANERAVIATGSSWEWVLSRIHPQSLGEGQ